MMTTPTAPPIAATDIAEAFAAMPLPARDIALALRALIFEVASQTPQAGPIEETLRWGQPAYITPQTKAGSTLRVGALKTGEGAVFAHCGTQIISTHAALFPKMDRIEGNRAVVFAQLSDIAPARLRLLIKHGLTYHLPAV